MQIYHICIVEQTVVVTMRNAALTDSLCVTAVITVKPKLIRWHNPLHECVQSNK